jgi:hypothetical protein
VWLSAEKSALDAVGVTRHRCWKYDGILEFDIKGLVDSIEQTSAAGCPEAREMQMGAALHRTMVDGAHGARRLSESVAPPRVTLSARFGSVEPFPALHVRTPSGSHEAECAPSKYVSPKHFKGMYFSSRRPRGSKRARDRKLAHLSGRIEVHPIRCAHASMMESRPLAEIGSILTVVLERRRPMLQSSDRGK